MLTWQFSPEYVFPFVASLAPLCWFASKNHTANFLGAGRGGIGLLNITLDWSNITSTVITYPYSVQIVVFAGFVLKTWILIPVAYFGNLWGSPTHNIMSNGVFLKIGTTYPFTSLSKSSGSPCDLSRLVIALKSTRTPMAYRRSMKRDMSNLDLLTQAHSTHGRSSWSVTFLFNIDGHLTLVYRWYASYISSFAWCGLFLGPKIAHLWKVRKTPGAYHKDRLNQLIQQYPGMTKW